MREDESDPTAATRRTRLETLDAVGWGLFLIWIGVAFLGHVGWALGILGVGCIALGGQVARKYLGLNVDPLGLVIGTVFVVWGAWDLLGLRLGQARMPGSFLPILCIVLGAMVLVSALRRRLRH